MVKENESEYNDPGIRNKALDSRQFEWIYIVKTVSLYFIIKVRTCLGFSFRTCVNITVAADTIENIKNL